jgi:hypothetical protein
MLVTAASVWAGLSARICMLAGTVAVATVVAAAAHPDMRGPVGHRVDGVPAGDLAGRLHGPHRVGPLVGVHVTADHQVDLVAIHCGPWRTSAAVSGGATAPDRRPRPRPGRRRP